MDFRQDYRLKQRVTEGQVKHVHPRFPESGDGINDGLRGPDQPGRTPLVRIEQTELVRLRPHTFCPADSLLSCLDQAGVDAIQHHTDHGPRVAIGFTTHWNPVDREFRVATN